MCAERGCMCANEGISDIPIMVNISENPRMWLPAFYLISTSFTHQQTISVNLITTSFCNVIAIITLSRFM